MWKLFGTIIYLMINTMVLAQPSKTGYTQKNLNPTLVENPAIVRMLNCQRGCRDEGVDEELMPMCQWICQSKECYKKIFDDMTIQKQDITKKMEADFKECYQKQYGSMDEKGAKPTPLNVTPQKKSKKKKKKSKKPKTDEEKKEL